MNFKKVPIKKAFIVTLIYIAIMLGSAILISKAFSADKSYGDIEVSRITGVYDGDTFYVNIKGWPALIGTDIPIRIAHIDTPELRGTKGRVYELAMEAKSFTYRRLALAHTIWLRHVRRGKYFRIIAEVEIDGKDLGRELLLADLAKPYEGGPKPRW